MTDRECSVDTAATDILSEQKRETDSSDTDTQKSSESEEYSREEFASQNDLVLRGLDMIIPLAADAFDAVAEEFDNSLTSMWRDLVRGVQEWVEDACKAGSPFENTSSRFRELLETEGYEEKFGKAAIEETQRELTIRVDITGTVPKAYAAHWIMFSIWKDILSQKFPTGINASLKPVLGDMAAQVRKASGHRDSLRYRPWFSQAMAGLTLRPTNEFIRNRKADTSDIADCHLSCLRGFFDYPMIGSYPFEEQYTTDINDRAIILDRLVKCSGFGHRFVYMTPPEEAFSGEHALTQFKDVDTLADINAWDVGNVYRLALYPALVRVRHREEGEGDPIILQAPAFIADPNMSALFEMT